MYPQCSWSPETKDKAGIWTLVVAYKCRACLTISSHSITVDCVKYVKYHCIPLRKSSSKDLFCNVRSMLLSVISKYLGQ